MNFARLAIAVALAAVTTFGLLLLMNSLVNVDLGEPDEVRETRMPDIHMMDEEIETRRDTQRPDRPEDVDQPPPDMPEPEFESPDINPEALSMAAPTSTGSEGIAGVGLGGDGEFLPIVRVAPEYPSNALSRRIEGYVTVEFTVTETGSVRDVQVIEAVTKDGNPTTIFNRAAVRAAERFKYRPRVIDGNPVEVPGVRNRFTFEIAE
ncbi:energy transducer TonB [Marinimicrobium alkaliphilum]|uniref:energy transducer TonB n=1 Tax=Marinimicrobium alkaliphilum TaxID=2202654 RepID=UPI000DB9D738|nr:energy transducer TonB [Marinimicrobium alkaliphilum]